MHWARQIEFKDLLDVDARVIYDRCGEEALLAVLDAFAGKEIHLREDVLENMKRRYIHEQGQSHTAKELARRLDVSEDFVREVREEEEKEGF